MAAALVATGAMVACGSDSSPEARPSSAPPPPSSSATPSASPSPSEENFVEPFDNNSNDWPTRSDSDGTRLAVTGGEYRVTLPAGSIRYIRPAALAQRNDVKRDVSIAGRVSVVDGETYAFGLACRMSPSDKQYYLGRLFENGTSAIVKRKKGEGEKVIKASRAEPIELEDGRPVQLQVLCGEKDGVMSIKLTVNGEEAAVAEDRDPLPENPPGIYAVAGLNTRTSSFAFDNIAVTPFTP